jgi:prophage regulatory protein
MQRFLRRPEVIRLTGLPRSTLHDLICAGRFPKPIHLSANRRGWLEDEVRAWQQERIAERDGKAA